MYRTPICLASACRARFAAAFAALVMMLRYGMLFALGTVVALLPVLTVLVKLQLRVKLVSVSNSGTRPGLPSAPSTVGDQGGMVIQVHGLEPRSSDKGAMTQCSKPPQLWNPILFTNGTYCSNVRLPGTHSDCFLVHTLASGQNVPYRICEGSRTMKDEPFVLGIGPPKTSSTVLFDALAQFIRFRRMRNPNRCCGMEFHFWSQDAQFAAGLEVYKTYWLSRGPGLFFEKTPEYFYNPMVAYRVVQLVPHAKLVITLRLGGC